VKITDLLEGNWILRGSSREGLTGRGRSKTKAAPLAPHTEKRPSATGWGAFAERRAAPRKKSTGEDAATGAGRGFIASLTMHAAKASPGSRSRCEPSN